MRRERGNVLLTAIFVAIFLFFLSVALLWTNRQDIALSLFMEHRIRAGSAARSAALESWARLRAEGAHTVSRFSFPGEVQARVELHEMEATEANPPMAELRARSTSGPVNSYTTIRMLKSTIATERKEKKDEPGRVLYLTDGRSRAQGLYGDFKLVPAKLEFQETDYLTAYQGPLFLSTPVQNSLEPFWVVDHVPVFMPNGTLMAYGPVALTAPKPTDETRLWVMRLEGEEFKWIDIPSPDTLGFDPHSQDTTEVKGRLPYEGRPSPWTVTSLRAVEDAGTQFIWVDEQPGTGADHEMLQKSRGAGFSVDSDSLTLSYGETRYVKNVWGYSLRGAIASYQNKVYSHGWQYLYRRYAGFPKNPPVPDNLGHQITRWPCILAYDLDSKRWEVAWSSLTDGGDVHSKETPNPNILLVSEQGKLYSFTQEGVPRLMQMESGGRVTLGANLTGSGTPVVYKGKPHLLEAEGLRDLESHELFGFEDLIQELPEISGLVVQPPAIVISEEGVGTGGPLSLEATEMRTTRHRHQFTYRIPPGVRPAVDGPDLWVPLVIEVSREDPSFNFLGEEPAIGPEGATFRVLARFDGERWQVLPHGIPPLLGGEQSGQKLSLDPEMRNLYCAWYEGLPPQRPRHTVVQIHTNPVLVQ